MTDENELDSLLDDLGDQYNQARDEPAPIEELGPKDEPIDEPEEPEAKNPPGFIDNIKEWVDAGHDPDDFKGKNAYKKEYDHIQDNKVLRATIRENNASLKTIVNAIGTQVQVAKEGERAKVVAEFEEARKNDDTEGVIVAQEKLVKIDTAPIPADILPSQPLVTSFLEDNPILDQGSDQFDAKANRQFSRIYDNKLRSLDDGSNRFTKEDIEDCLSSAFQEVKSLNSALFESPRNNREGQPQRKKRTKANAPPTSVSAVERSNPRDHTAANDTYEMIKKLDPKAAERFAQAMGAEQ